ncbi:bifunctional 4-hydroxy-2-oxoglutarate aldolase/2-dehydro-3-deoxy-phosphogluconate aldolase [Nocardia sp. NPDC004722]
MNLLQLLVTHQVMAIVRARTSDCAKSIVTDLTTQGIRLMEISLNTPGALDLIADCAAELDTVGAGTVISVQNARDVVAAGASYLVTPVIIPEILAEADRLGVPVLCGAFTPTEVLEAWQRGATAVKIFPASLGGPAYLEALRAVLPDIPLVPVGGVEIDQISGYFGAGSIAVGLGSPLTGGDIAERCERLRKALP